MLRISKPFIRKKPFLTVRRGKNEMHGVRLGQDRLRSGSRQQILQGMRDCPRGVRVSVVDI